MVGSCLDKCVSMNIEWCCCLMIMMAWWLVLGQRSLRRRDQIATSLITIWSSNFSLILCYLILGVADNAYNYCIRIWSVASSFHYLLTPLLFVLLEWPTWSCNTLLTLHAVCLAKFFISQRGCWTKKKGSKSNMSRNRIFTGNKFSTSFKGFYELICLNDMVNRNDRCVQICSLI